MTDSTQYPEMRHSDGTELLDWARRLNALAQTGLTFAENPYDIERYTAIRTIAAQMIAHASNLDPRVLGLLAIDAG